MARFSVWLPLYVTLLAGPGPARAEEPAALDEDFLEFLGSLDSDDEAWGEMLASAQVREASRDQDEEKAESKQVDP